MASNNINNLRIRNNDFLQKTLRYGVIGGLIGIGLHIFSYLILMPLSSSGSFTPMAIFALIGFFRYVVVIIIMAVMAVRKHRDKDMGGYISGLRCFAVSMTTILTVHVIYLLWYIVLHEFIEPGIFADFDIFVYTENIYKYVLIFGVLVSLIIGDAMKK